MRKTFRRIWSKSTGKARVRSAHIHQVDELDGDNDFFDAEDDEDDRKEADRDRQESDPRHQEGRDRDDTRKKGCAAQTFGELQFRSRARRCRKNGQGEDDDQTTGKDRQDSWSDRVEIASAQSRLLPPHLGHQHTEIECCCREEDESKDAVSAHHCSLGVSPSALPIESDMSVIACLKSGPER